MKAAVLNAFGSPLAIETLPDPRLGTGEVVVDEQAPHLLERHLADQVLGQVVIELLAVAGDAEAGSVKLDTLRLAASSTLPKRRVRLRARTGAKCPLPRRPRPTAV